MGAGPSWPGVRGRAGGVGVSSAEAGSALPSGAALCGRARPEPGAGLDWEAGTRRAGLRPPRVRVSPVLGSTPASRGARCRTVPPRAGEPCAGQPCAGERPRV